MNEVAPDQPVGSIVHWAESEGAACRAALVVGYNEYGSADLVIFGPNGMEFRPAWFGETSNDHGWHLIH